MNRPSVVGSWYAAGEPPGRWGCRDLRTLFKAAACFLKRAAAALRRRVRAGNVLGREIFVFHLSFLLPSLSISLPAEAAHQRERSEGGSVNFSASAGRDILGEVDQTSVAAATAADCKFTCALSACQSQTAATSLVISGNRVVFHHERGFALPRGAPGERVGETSAGIHSKLRGKLCSKV